MPTITGVLEKVSSGSVERAAAFSMVKREHIQVGKTRLRRCVIDAGLDDLLSEAMGKEVSISFVGAPYFLMPTQIVAIRLPDGTIERDGFGRHLFYGLGMSFILAFVGAFLSLVFGLITSSVTIGVLAFLVWLGANAYWLLSRYRAWDAFSA